MLAQQLLEIASTAVEWSAGAVPPPAEIAGEDKGEEIAGDLRSFIGPIAAVLIGIVALKFLFGENKSLAAFIGFMILAIVVYGLIQFGDAILEPLAEMIKGWVED